MLRKHVANIGYSGTLKIKVKDGHKTLQTYEYHNAGTDYLFTFLCNCISGEYRIAERNRPFKIKLYDRTDAYFAGELPKVDEPVSGFISVNTPATIDPTDGHISVTLHFLVPYSNISGDRICQVCLYGALMGTGDESKYSAYYYFADPIKNDWDPIKIDNTHKANYSLIIEWTLSFTNIAETTTSN